MEVKVFTGGSAGTEPEIEQLINEWLKSVNVEILSISINGMPIETSQTNSPAEIVRRLDRPAIAMLVYRSLS